MDQQEVINVIISTAILFVFFFYLDISEWDQHQPIFWKRVTEVIVCLSLAVTISVFVFVHV